MSIHLVSVAALLPIKPSQKLALLCLAEDSRDRDRHASPGFDVIKAWVGCRSDSVVYEALERLQELRLLEQVGRGQKGKRAVFVVFPDGCCEPHGKVPSGRSTVDPDDLGSGSAVPDPEQDGSASGVPDPDRVADPLSASGLSDPDSACGFSGQPDPESASASGFARSASGLSPSASGQPEPSRKTPLGTSPGEPTYVTPPGAASRPAHIPEPSAADHDRQRLRLLCGHCTGGWLLDDDDRPVAKCLTCHPAHRAAASA